jgi:hypothetical protein
MSAPKRHRVEHPDAQAGIDLSGALLQALVNVDRRVSCSFLRPDPRDIDQILD